MSWSDFLGYARGAFIIGGAVGAVVFPLYYHFTAKWYRDRVGRFLMLGGLGWASLYLSAVVSMIFPNDLAREIIRTALTLFAFYFVWRQTFLYRKVRKEELVRRQKERREQ